MEPDVHVQLSATSFNEVWQLLEKADRSAEEDRLMREMAHASLFHWLKRPDCTPTNLSIGLWQVSRVYAVLGCAEASVRYAGECFDVTEQARLSPFCMGYACEAQARAALTAGDREGAREWLERTRHHLALVEDDEDRVLLAGDVQDLAEALGA